MALVKSPEEVFKLIQEDFKSRGLNTQDAAKLLGYKGRQTLYSLWATKQYMKPEPAQRFVDAFGYDYSFLTTGEGHLFKKEPELRMVGKIKFNELRQTALVEIADYLIKTSEDKSIISAWNSIQEKNLTKYRDILRKRAKLIDKQLDDELYDIVVLDGLELCGRIACTKDIDALIKNEGYIDAQMLSSYLHPNSR